jgi:hypothetical protein
MRMNLPHQVPPVARSVDGIAPQVAQVAPSWQFRCFDNMLYIRDHSGAGAPMLWFTCGANTGWKNAERPTGSAP